MIVKLQTQQHTSLIASILSTPMYHLRVAAEHAAILIRVKSIQCLDWCVTAELWGLVEKSDGVLAVCTFASCELNLLGVPGGDLKVVHCCRWAW
jgi:hypothetical protein